jgi:hypothetical protein
MSKISKVHQIDRVVIAIIGLLSVLSDHWLSDWLIMISMLLRLWPPEWKEKLLLFSDKKHIQAKKGNHSTN